MGFESLSQLAHRKLDTTPPPFHIEICIILLPLPLVFPSQEKVKAKGETMELLKMFFGIDREYLPNATEILRVAPVFQEK